MILPYIKYMYLSISSQTIQRGPGGSMSQVVGLPNNSYMPITNTAWVCARLCKLQKGCTRFAAASDKVYQLFVHGWWFSPGTLASSTTKIGCHDIAKILLKVALKHQKSNQINQNQTIHKLSKTNLYFKFMRSRKIKFCTNVEQFTFQLYNISYIFPLCFYITKFSAVRTFPVYQYVPCKDLPKIATTISSLNISIEPLDIKYIAVRTSPLCTSVSPGGTCVVLNFMDKARKQPGLAPAKIK